jgi:proliferating cell nuclear antigen
MEAVGGTSAATAAATDYLFRIRTVKAAPFRTLTEAIKDILTDANLEIDSTGLKIMAMDGTHTILVHLRLRADRFDEFVCPKRHVLGINMINFFKLVKTMSNSESIVLYMKKSDTTKLGIEILNGEKQMVTNFSLNLIELDVNPIPIPPVQFASIITMPSVDFQKIVRDMHTLGEVVEIQSASQELVFRCKGDYAEQETVFSIGTNGLTQKISANEIVQGNFFLKHLVLFTKCTSLCSDISLYLKNDYPIIVEYNVAGLGEIKLALAPALTKPADSA